MKIYHSPIDARRLEYELKKLERYAKTQLTEGICHSFHTSLHSNSRIRFDYHRGKIPSR